MSDTNEKMGEVMLPDGRIVSFKTKASTVFLSDGKTVEDAVNDILTEMAGVNSALDSLVEV